MWGLALALGIAASSLPARADVVRQSATNVPVLRKVPDGQITGYGYRRQLVDVSNCFQGSELIAGDSFYGLATNLSTGLQGYSHDYYLGGRCGR